MSDQTIRQRTCDACGMRAQHQTDPAQYGGIPFAGWVVLEINKSGLHEGMNGRFDFCSIACARKFLVGGGKAAP